MYSILKHIIQLIFFVLLFSTFALAQKSKEKEVITTRILFIFDASNSMNGKWQSGAKIDIAQKLLANTLDSLQNIENLELALRIYGHTKPFPPQDCDDTRLEVPFSKNNINLIKSKLKNVKPKGTTPIAETLEKSSNDFPPCSNCRNIIILITDGIEECKGDPCAVSLALQQKGIVLKPFVIGVGLDMEFKKTFECVGNYYDAANEESFRTVLNIVITQALNSTTAQINLLNINGKPTETDVPITIYNAHSGKIEYSFVHTLNHRGNPDTLRLDPIPMYKIVVHTIPSVAKDSIKIIPGIHNIIAVDAPQGLLNIKSAGGSDKQPLQAIIRKKGDLNTLIVQSLPSTEKYLVGKYDIEILTLPRTYLYDIDIKQSHTTSIEIPQSGILTISKNSPGYGSILLEEKNELKLVTNLSENSLRETYQLQPGNYRVVYRPKSAKESVYTIEEKFKIQSGGSASIKL